MKKPPPTSPAQTEDKPRRSPRHRARSRLACYLLRLVRSRQTA